MLETCHNELQTLSLDIDPGVGVSKMELRPHEKTAVVKITNWALHLPCRKKEITDAPSAEYLF